MTSWGAAGYKLQKDARDEQKELEKAGKRKGLWASVGSAIGGIAALGLTATMGPFGAAIATAALTAGGGFIGKEVLTSKKNKDLLKAEGGKFHKGGREEMDTAITQDVIKSSLQSGLAAGVASGVKAAKAGKIGDPPVKPTTPIDTGVDDWSSAAKAPAGTTYKAPNPNYVKPDPSHGIIDSQTNQQFVTKTVKGDNVLDTVWDYMKKGAERRDHM